MGWSREWNRERDTSFVVMLGALDTSGDVT